MYGVPKNISIRVKNKYKISSSLEEGQNVKHQNSVLIGESHETLNAAFVKWFLNMLSQNVPLPGAIIQEKVGIYVKELKIKENFEASDCSLRC